METRVWNTKMVNITENEVYIKVLYDGNVSYLTVYTDDVIKNFNNETAFP